MGSGYIYGGNPFFCPSFPGQEQFGGFLPDILVQLDDEAIFSKTGIKLAGDHSVDGVIPANQYLGSDDTLGPDIEERLKIGDKVAVFLGRLHGLDQGLLPGDLLTELLVEDRVRLAVGKCGPSEEPFWRNLPADRAACSGRRQDRSRNKGKYERPVDNGPCHAGAVP